MNEARARRSAVRRPAARPSPRSPLVRATSSCSAPAARWDRRSRAWRRAPPNRQPTRHRRLALVVRRAPSVRSNEAGVETVRVRSARPRRRRTPARRAERRLHGRPEVRHDRRAGDDVGDEHHRPRQLRRALSRLAHRRVLDRQRLFAHASRRSAGRARRTRSARSANTPRRASGASASSSSYAERYGTRVAIVRLNYAIDLRYGVLVDIATRVQARRASAARHGIRERDLAGRRERIALECLAA